MVDCLVVGCDWAMTLSGYTKQQDDDSGSARAGYVYYRGTALERIGKGCRSSWRCFKPVEYRSLQAGCRGRWENAMRLIGSDWVRTAHKQRTKRPLVVMLVTAAALAFAGCGSAGPEQEIGSQATASTVSIVDPNDATTLADDDDEVVEEEELTDAGVEPIERGINDDPIAAMIEAVHGSSTDLTRDFSQLLDFPSVPTPGGSHVLDFSLNSLNDDRDDRTRHLFEINLVTDDAPEQVQRAFQAELEASGWSLTNTEYNNTVAIEEDHERRSYRRTNDSGVDETLAVTSIDKAPTGMKLYYTASFVAEELDSSLRGWYGEDAPLPEGAGFSSASVSSTWDPEEIRYTLLSDHPYGDAADPTKAGIYSEIASLIDAGPLPIERDGGTYFDLAVPGFGSYSAIALDGKISMRANRSFRTPLIGETPAAAEQSDDELVAMASPQQIAAMLGELHGRHEDVSAQMRRLGLFPDLPTPVGSSILDLDVGLERLNPDPDVVTASARVEIALDGEFEEVETFYRAQLAADGWELKQSRPTTERDNAQGVEYSYSRPGVETNLDLPPLAIEVSNEPEYATVRVVIRYQENLSNEQVDWNRWLGWEGDAPIPPNGQLVGMSLSSRLLAGDTALLTATYNFPDLDADEVLAAVEDEGEGSDYTRNPALDDTGFGDLDFTHPAYARVGAASRGARQGADLMFNVALDFTRS